MQTWRSLRELACTWPVANNSRDRANLRFADVEASGRADIIWINKYTGASTVYKNNGFKGVGEAPGGSSFQWTNRGVLYSGVSRGENLVSGRTTNLFRRISERQLTKTLLVVLY